MADVHDPAIRSRNMAAIRSSNTKPELLIRHGLHRRGYRYRISRRDLPGKPDIVLTRLNAVIFVHGCFWHGHDCPLFRIPSTRTEFWENKIAANQMRDHSAQAALQTRSWRVATIWECALKGRDKIDEDEVFGCLTRWLDGDEGLFEIRGTDASRIRPAQ